MTLLGRAEAEVWEMRIGHLLDQIELYKQFNGLAEPVVEHFIDDIIPGGI